MDDPDRSVDFYFWVGWPAQKVPPSSATVTLKQINQIRFQSF
jgi:hypothetical protein